MNRSLCTMFGASLLLLLAAGLLAAAELAAMPKPAQIQQWVRDLGSDQPAVREEASRRLVDAGLPALDDIEDALKSKDLEVRTRAERILRKLRKKLAQESVPEIVKLAEEGRFQEFMGRLLASKDHLDDAQLEKCWRAALKLAERAEQRAIRAAGEKRVISLEGFEGLTGDDRKTAERAKRKCGPVPLKFAELETLREPDPRLLRRHDILQKNLVIANKAPELCSFEDCVIITGKLNRVGRCKRCLVLCEQMGRVEGTVLESVVLVSGKVREGCFKDSFVYCDEINNDLAGDVGFENCLFFSRCFSRESALYNSIIQFDKIVEKEFHRPTNNVFINLTEKEFKALSLDRPAKNRFVRTERPPLVLFSSFSFSRAGVQFANLRISVLAPDGLFAGAGFQMGDEIICADLRGLMSNKSKGMPVLVEVKRGTQSLILKLRP